MLPLSCCRTYCIHIPLTLISITWEKGFSVPVPGLTDDRLSTRQVWLAVTNKERVSFARKMRLSVSSEQRVTFPRMESGVTL
jgi:hypothetical protein